MGKLIWCLGFIIWAAMVVIIHVSYVRPNIPAPELLEFVTDFMMVLLVGTAVISYWRLIMKGWWFCLLWGLRLPGIFIMLVTTTITAMMLKYDKTLLKVNTFVTPKKKRNYL